MPPSTLRLVSFPPSLPASASSPGSLVLSSLSSHYCVPLSAGSSSLPLSVKNNYFSADIVVAKNDSFKPPSADAPAQGFEGVIVAYGPSADLKALRAFVSSTFCSGVRDDDFESHDGADGPDGGDGGERARAGPDTSSPDELRLLICVCSSADEEARAKELLDSLQAAGDEELDPQWWGLEYGFEWCLSRCDEDGIKMGFDTREKEGFARVVEALETTMWRSKVDKKSAVRSGGGAAAVVASDAPLSGTPLAQPPSPVPTPQESAAAKTESLPEDAVRASSATDSQDLRPPEPPTSSSRALLEALGSSEGGVAAALDEDGLDRLLASMASIRQRSLNGGFATDDDRKRAAAEAAEKLMRLLGDMEGGEDDEDDDEDFSQYLKNKTSDEGK